MPVSRSLRLVTFGLVLVAACRCTPIDRAVTAPIGAADTSIFFPTPTLLSAEQVFIRYEDHEQRTDYAGYLAANARAEALLLRANAQPDLVLSLSDLVQATPEAIRAWRRHSNATVILGERRFVRARERNYRVLPFATPKDGPCFLFSARGDRQHDDRRRRPKLAVVGYYCEPEGEPFDDLRIGAILEPLELSSEGYLVPSLDPGDIVILPADAGHTGFPLQIARHFSPRDGDSSSF